MRRAFHLVVATLIGLLTQSVAWAQTTRTWTGLAGPIVPNTTTYDFQTAGNWSGNVAPVNGDNLVFGPLPSVSISLTNAFTAGNITFNGIQNGLYLVGPSSLTLNGNVATTAGSIYWGIFDTPVSLSAGNHIYTIDGSADIYHFAAISGAGGITTNGPNNLILGAPSTYTGGTVINAGTLYAGSDSALGTGTITINGGALATSYTSDLYAGVFLPNNFLLGSNPTFGSYSSDSLPLSLGESDIGNTIRPVTGVTTVNLSLLGKDSLSIDGAIQDGASATNYTFSNDSANSGYVLTGTNTYTGGTVVVTNSSVTFNVAGAIPTSGLITVQLGAYAGLGDSTVTPATFLSRFSTSGSAGTIGFDYGNTYGGAIDLSGFSNIDLSIGTATEATLTGAITPVSGSGAYNFSGSGRLRLVDATSPNPLTGANDLVARPITYDRPSLRLVVSPTGTNNYTGATVADGAAIIFDTASSLPAATTIELSNGGYVSVTDSSELGLPDLVSKLGSVTNGGILGFDSSSNVNFDSGSTLTYSNPVNFGSLTQDVYLGSTSEGSASVTFSGAITTANGGTGNYFLSGFNNGNFTVSSLLTGAGKVLHVGVPGVFQSANYTYSNVAISNVLNDYTGGTILHSGQLQIAAGAALGSGSLTVDAVANSDRSASLFLSPSGVFAKDIILTSGNLYLAASGSTLTGNISGPGSLDLTYSATLSGNNSYTGGTFVSDRNLLTATTASALGSGGLTLTEGAEVYFTAASPQIGSLLLGEAYTDDGTVHASLVLAAPGTTQLTINQTDDGYFYGSIVQSGSVGSLIKSGPATLTIYGDLNFGDTRYSGGTTITGGTLIAGGDGALGTGAISLAGGNLEVSLGVTLANTITFSGGGGVLKGNATFSSPVTVGTNGKLSPGDSPGTMNFTAGLTLAAGGQLNFEVQSANGAAGTGYDLVKVSTGLLDISATSGSPFTIKLISLNPSGTAGNVSDFSLGTGYSWMLFEGNAVSGINGFAANNFILDTTSFSNSFAPGAFSFSQGVSGGNPAIYLNFTPVPEPSTYALLALGLAGIALKARRRRA